MNRYIPKEPVTVPAGTVLYLSDKQATVRATLVEKLGKGKYRAKEAQTFKAGDEFGMDGELPKHIAELVRTPEELEAANAEIARAEAGAKAERLAEARAVVASEVQEALKPLMATLTEKDAVALEDALAPVLGIAAAERKGFLRRLAGLFGK